MSKNQETHKEVESPVELKELFLLGTGIYMDDKIKGILESRKDCLIIGDGENPIDPKDIAKILQEKNLKIGSNTRIDINGHGSRETGLYQKQHMISLFKDIKYTGAVFSKLKEIAGKDMPLHVHLWSCYGGSANKSVNALGNDSILVTHVEAKERSSVTLANHVMHDSLQRYLDPQNNKITPHQQFILDLPKNFEAATFNQATKDGKKKFKFTRIPKEKYMQNILTQIDEHATLENFVNSFFEKEGIRFQQEFPNAEVKDAVNTISNISHEAAKEYAEGILVHSFTVDNQKFAKKSADEFLAKLQKKGVNINNTPDNNMNALHRCIDNKNGEMTEVLLERGANPNIQDKYGRTPLHFAINNNADFTIGLTNADFTIELIRAGANPSIQDKYGRTPLHLAINNKNEELAILLIEQGANPDIKDNEGRTPIELAAEDNQPEVVLKLIEKGADFSNLKSKSLSLLLPEAIKRNPEAALKIIESNRIKNINVLDNDKNTFLHLAIENGQTQVALKLIEKGSNFNIENEDDLTATDVANKMKNNEVIAAIKEQNLNNTLKDIGKDIKKHIPTNDNIPNVSNVRIDKKSKHNERGCSIF